MKRIFIDTNILIDFLARRGQFFNPACCVVSRSKRGDTILVSALSFATTSYVLTTHHKMSNETVVRLFENFVKTCRITPVDSQTIDESIASEFDDFEDAMQYYSALKAKADIIITRNGKDFTASQIPVMTATEYLVSIE